MKSNQRLNERTNERTKRSSPGKPPGNATNTTRFQSNTLLLCRRAVRRRISILTRRRSTCSDAFKASLCDFLLRLKPNHVETRRVVVVVVIAGTGTVVVARRRGCESPAHHGSMSRQTVASDVPEATTENVKGAKSKPEATL